jgi:hypothetical protein
MLRVLDRVPGFRWLYTRYRQFVTGGVFLKTQECPVDEIERYKKGANAMQVGGKHYKQLPIEPWDYIAANGLGFFEGNIIKYITRAGKSKNRDDLLKAQHYLAKLLEITPVEREERQPKLEPIVPGEGAEPNVTTIEARSFRSAENQERPR